MKIAIIGTRGIPNNYGGFEQFAEFLSVGLVEKGHNVTVYNSHNHPYKKAYWNGVDIIHKFDPENSVGTVGQFIYDFNCISDLKNHEFDIILQLGYTSNSVWNKLLPSQPRIVTNMDGLEWNRTKYNKLTQQFLKYAERLAAYSSDFLVSDSIGIKEYIENKYGLISTFIPYGANLFLDPQKDVLNEFKVLPYRYNILIARMEPENNIEAIVKAHSEANTSLPLLLIGNTDNNFSKYLLSQYDNNNIRFLGGIYDQQKLNNLRYYSNLYFHGHSVGGTNPSLLEAMGSNSLICAHDNIFNNSILGNDAFYFSSYSDIVKLLEQNVEKRDYEHLLENNKQKILKIYSWKAIIDQYENLFLRALRDN